MLNLLCEGSGSSSWIMLVVLAALFILMLVMTIVPQRKRKKQAQQMMSTVKAGVKVKTIGGFVGTIRSVDDVTNVITLDISANEDGSMVVTMDKSAIYTVLTPMATEPEVVTEAGAVVEEEGIVSADDAEEAAKEADKKAEKKAKKEKKAHEKAEKEAEQAANTESTDIVVEPEAVEVEEPTPSEEN